MLIRDATSPTKKLRIVIHRKKKNARGTILKLKETIDNLGFKRRYFSAQTCLAKLVWRTYSRAPATRLTIGQLDLSFEPLLIKNLACFASTKWDSLTSGLFNHIPHCHANLVVTDSSLPAWNFNSS